MKKRIVAILLALTFVLVFSFPITAFAATHYKMTYNGNGNDGGTVPSDNTNYSSGDTVSVKAIGTMAKLGYTFDHWNTKQDNTGTSYHPLDTFKITSDTTLFAQWTANTYTVTYYANGGSGTTMTSSSFTYGVSANLSTNTYTRTGYTFAGWATSPTGLVAYSDGQSVSNLTAANGVTVPLYALWTIIPSYSQLISDIASAQAEVNLAIPGYADGNYPQAAITDFQDAIDAANAVAVNPTSTSTDFTNADTTLLSAKATFEAAVVHVDKSDLHDAITAAQTEHDAAKEGAAEGNYPKQAIDDYQTAINAANSVYGNGQATQDEVNAAITNLASATSTFEAAVVHVDKSDLHDAITAAQTEHDAAKEGAAEGNYPKQAIDDYQTAINAANSVYGNGQATQDEVNAAITNLASGTSTFEAAVVHVDKSDLHDAITAAQTEHDAAKEGAAEGNYPKQAIDDYQTAINAANSVYGNGQATQDEVNAAITNLASATSTFEAAVVHVDKSDLHDAITAAQTEHDAAKEGAAEGNYPKQAIDDYQTAINAANSVYGNGQATQDEVNAAITNLASATSTFEAAVVHVDKSDLHDAITAAQTEHDAAKEGAAEGNYPKQAIDDYQTAINAANSVYGNGQATQDEVNAAITNLASGTSTFEAAVVHVDKSDLHDAITAAQTEHDAAKEGAAEGNYPKQAIDDYQTAINAANSVYGNGQATQDEVNAAITNLASATSTFEAAVVHVDKSDLHDAITAAQTEHDAAKEGAAEGNYPKQAIDDYQTAINAANSVYGNGQATQDEVNAAITNLASATSTFEAAVVHVDKSDLHDAITAAQTEHDAAKEGAAEGNYPKQAIDDYQTAINAANSVYGNGQATQDEVNAAITNLASATSTFEAAVVHVDKSDLHDAITAAQTEHDAAKEGAAEGNYPKQAIDDYQTAINAANSVYGNGQATQDEVNAAITNLASATSTFEAAVVHVDKSDLHDAITAAQTEHDAAKEGAAEGNYPKQAIDDYQTAINAANSVYGNGQATQDEVNAAITNLASATSTFEAAVVHVDKSDLHDAITAAETQIGKAVAGSKPGDYPQSAIDVYQNAIDAAKAVMNNPAATQTNVNNAIDALNTAKTTFEAAVIPTPTYTVTYAGNGNDGGTAPTDTKSPYTSGSTVTVLDKGTLTKNGFNFAGWKDGSGKSYSAGETFTITANTVLTAQWTAIPVTTYTVTYAGNGNDGGTAPTDTKSPYTSGSTVTVLDKGTLTKNGFNFAGWKDGSGKSYSAGDTFTIMSNTVLTAQWTAIPVTTSTLTIKCQDNASTAAISGVLMDVYNGSNTKVGSRTSNGSGVVTVSGLPAGAYYITVTSVPSEYNMPSSNIALTIDQGQDKTVIIPLTTKVKAYTNLQLKDIKVSKGTLSPTFDADTNRYTLKLDSKTTSTKITPVLSDSSSKLYINGKNVKSITVTLKNGKSQKITIRVKSSDGNSNYYYVTVSKALSNNANLKMITTTKGHLQPAFSPNTTTYALALTSKQASVTLGIQLSSNLAKYSINVNGKATKSRAIALKKGQTKTVKITVRAQDGTTKKVYLITITRAS